WHTPAPVSVLNSRPAALVPLVDAHGTAWWLRRDLPAEAEAMDTVRGLGLLPVSPTALQWRSPEAAEGHEPLWSLVQEDAFGDLWADRLPALQAQGWSVVVCPGFAHESVPVERWHVLVDSDTGEVLGKEVAQAGPAGALR